MRHRLVPGLRVTGPERVSDETASKAPKRNAQTPAVDAQVAVASGGAVLTEDAVADLQRMAGNQATRSLIQRAPQENSDVGAQPAGAQPGGAQPVKSPDPSAPEEVWVGSVKGSLAENPEQRHTMYNHSDKELEYLLRIRNEGYATLSLETQYEMANGETQRAWTALYANHGETRQVTNGLPPQWTLHLRLFGERDPMQPDQYYVKGEAEARRTK